jgi:dihydropteroate synthase
VPASSGRATLCGRRVSGDRALIMAIVNRTPDSFYDRGATFSDEAARAAAHRVIAEGADVIDVGGVKAGPGRASTPKPRPPGWCRSSSGCATHIPTN